MENGPTDLHRRSGVIAVIGDTQRTLALERLLLRREQNDAERCLLIDAIAAAGPDVLVHLGDLVADGASAADWARFDRLTARLRDAGIPILPARGNHEFGGGLSALWPGASRAALRHFAERFPDVAKARWYERRYGPLVMLWLDTNVRRMPAADWSRQTEWFRQRVTWAESDSATAGVLVFAHHPPFTNSRVTGDERHVQEAFVPAFLSARKTLAFITGHAHAYERFAHGGKTFLVCGGGGGARVPLLQGARCRHRDLFGGPSPRPFHFLLLRPEDARIRVQVRGVVKGSGQLHTLEELLLSHDGRA